MKIDLHIHTNKSDGEYSPKEIIDKAKKLGVSVISITDHDTIDAYSEELFSYAKAKGIKIIPGVEISTKIEKAGIHVLGYNFDLKNKEFALELEKIRNSRHIYLYEVSKKLESLGYKVNVKKLDRIKSVTKAHIASDIVENEENKEKLLAEFGYIPKRGEFIETIMNENCIAYVKKNTVTPKEAGKAIRKAGGKVVLAHPVAYEFEDNLAEEDILKIIEELKPDGIEANYLYVKRNGELVDETQKWNLFAKKHKLFVTVGTDFHKKDDLHPEIGFANIDFKLEDNVIDEIINNINKKER